MSYYVNETILYVTKVKKEPRYMNDWLPCSKGGFYIYEDQCCLKI